MHNFIYTFLCTLLLLFFAQTATAQQQTVSGNVTDESGEVLIGVSVAVKGTTSGTITDFNGNYSIAVLPNETLVFSYVGYETQEQKAGKSLAINVVLKEVSKTLDEVIVVGYGTQKKSDLTGSVVSVKTDDMNAIPTSSIAEMLRGQAAGVVVTQNSARPGGSSDIIIRGQKSLTGSNAPLYIVDGVPVSNIDDFNSQDIESVEVLKDASAQSIYGARASNGVILVTTKRGAKNKTTIDLSAYAGVQTLKRNFDLYSGSEWAQLKREANRSFDYDATTGTYSGTYADDASLFGNMYPNLINENYTNWESLMIKPALQQKYDLSLRSGNDKTQFAAAFGFFDQEGMVAPSAYKRYNFRFNAEHQVFKKLKIGIRANYTYSNKIQEDSDFSEIITESPLLSAYSENGTLLSLLANSKYNPLWNNENCTNETKTNRFLLNFTLDWNIWKGLSYKLNTSLNTRNMEQGIYQNSLHEKGSTLNGIASIDNTVYTDYLLENILNYECQINKNNRIDATIVQSINAIKTTETTSTGSGFAINDLGYNNIGAASTTNPTERTITPRNLVSFMGRVRYNLMEKYMFSLSARIDGSSVFGVNNKWGIFPAGSFAWRIIEEDFMEDVSWLSNLKLRLSYGSVGNQAISPYQTQGLVDSYYMQFGDNNALVGYLPGAQLPNPNLKWETTTSLNAGIDFGFLKERISGSIEYYHSTTQDLLVKRAINQTSGYSSQLVNMGSVLNQGIEASLNFIPVKTKDFSWVINVTFAANQNKILSLYGTTEDDITNNWFIGHNINAYYDYVFEGIWQLNEEIPDFGDTYKPQPGDIKIKDVDGNGIINDEDRIVIDREPKWTGSLGSTLKWKGIDFSFDFYTVQGAIRRNPYLYDANSGGDLHGNNNGIKVNYWTLENPSNTNPRPRDETINYFSSLSYQNASYFRLRNLSIGYSFPKKWMKTIHVSNLRIYATATNLWTSTEFLSYSPEATAGAYPEPRTFIGGINISF